MIGFDRVAAELNKVEKIVQKSTVWGGRKLGVDMRKIPMRGLKSATDAVEASFGKTGLAADEMGRAVQRTVGNIGKLATAKTPFNLKEMGIDQISPKIQKIGGAQKIINQVTAEQNALLKQQPAILEKIKGIMDKTGTTSMSNLDKQQGLIDKIGKMGTMKAQGFDVSQATRDMKVLAAQTGITGKQFTKAFKEGEIAASRFDMRMLSILFGAMAIKRAFGGLLRSMVNTYKKAEGDTSALSMATTRLGAAWEFLKFSMIDAMGVNWFLNIIDGIINVLDWFSALPEGVRCAITTSIATVATLAGGLMVYAMGKLFWKNFLGVTHLDKAVGGIRNVIIKRIPKAFKLSPLLFTATAGLVATIATISLFSKDGNSFGEQIFTVVGMAWFGASIGRWVGGMPGLVLGAVIGATAGILLNIVDIKLEEKEKAGFKQARRGVQELINESFEKGFIIETDLLSDVIERSIKGIDNAQMNAAFADMKERLDLKIIDEDQFREEMLSLVGARDIPDTEIPILKTLSEKDFDKFGLNARLALGNIIGDIDEKFIPAIEGSSTILDAPEDSLNASLINVGGEMDILSTYKTETFISASSSRITQIELEIEANEKLRQSQSRSLGGDEPSEYESSADYYRGNLREQSSVSG